MKPYDLGGCLNWRITLSSTRFQWQSWCSPDWLLKNCFEDYKNTHWEKRRDCFFAILMKYFETIDLLFFYVIALIFKFPSFCVLTLTSKYTPTSPYVSLTLKVMNTFFFFYCVILFKYLIETFYYKWFLKILIPVFMDSYISLLFFKLGWNTNVKI